VYGEGSGFECRKHVQHLNLLRKNMDEQALAGCNEGDSVEHDTNLVASVDLYEPQEHVMIYISIMPFSAFSSLLTLADITKRE